MKWSSRPFIIYKHPFYVNPFLNHLGLQVYFSDWINPKHSLFLWDGRKVQTRTSFSVHYGLKHGMPHPYRSSVAFWAHSKELLCAKFSSSDHIFSEDLGGSSTCIVSLVIMWALLGMHRPVSLIIIMTLLKEIILLELGILNTKRRIRNRCYRGLELGPHIYKKNLEELVILAYVEDKLTKYSFPVSKRNISELWPKGENIKGKRGNTFN